MTSPAQEEEWWIHQMPHKVKIGSDYNAIIDTERQAVDLLSQWTAKRNDVDWHEYLENRDRWGHFPDLPIGKQRPPQEDVDYIRHKLDSGKHAKLTPNIEFASDPLLQEALQYGQRDAKGKVISILKRGPTSGLPDSERDRLKWLDDTREERMGRYLTEIRMQLAEEDARADNSVEGEVRRQELLDQASTIASYMNDPHEMERYRHAPDIFTKDLAFTAGLQRIVNRLSQHLPDGGWCDIVKKFDHGHEMDWRSNNERKLARARMMLAEHKRYLTSYLDQVRWEPDLVTIDPDKTGRVKHLLEHTWDHNLKNGMAFGINYAEGILPERMPGLRKSSALHQDVVATRANTKRANAVTYHKQQKRNRPKKT
jgi:hypothetical protein